MGKLVLVGKDPLVAKHTYQSQHLEGKGQEDYHEFGTSLDFNSEFKTSVGYSVRNLKDKTRTSMLTALT